MTNSEKRKANAEAQARSRQGVKHELRQIRVELKDLREALAEKAMVRKSFIQDNDYGDD